MKKYPYAQLYLKLLLVVTVLCLSLAVCLACICGHFLISRYNLYGATKKAPLNADTGRLSSEISTATDVVRQFTRRTEAFAFESELSKYNIEIASHANVQVGKIDDYERYLDATTKAGGELKQELLSAFHAAINQLRDAAQTALRSLDETARRNAARSQPVTRPQVNETGVERVAHLFEPKVLERARLESIMWAASFLKNEVSVYSPSPEARSLGWNAAGQLQALLELLRRESESIAKVYEQAKARPQTSTETEPTVSERASMLRDFIDRLNACDRLAVESFTTGWRLDAEVDRAKEVVMSYRVEKGKRLVELKEEVSATVFRDGVWILTLITAALVLLILRDFLSAMIDTAINTGMTANLLGSNSGDREQ